MPRRYGAQGRLLYFYYMSYECRHLRGTFCAKRQKECDPGEPGCVLRGRVSFPLKDLQKKEGQKRNKP